MMSDAVYCPLPTYLTIKSSQIHGLGLYTLVDLPADYEFGITHVHDERFEDGYIRTPLGGFFNHSSNPNCDAYVDGQFIKLKTLQEIEAGE